MTAADDLYAHLREALGDDTFQAAFDDGLRAPPPDPHLLADLRVLIHTDPADPDVATPEVA